MKRLLITLVVLVTAPALAQNTVTSIKSTEIGPGIHVLQGADGFAGGNIILLTGGEQIVLIDDGLGSVEQLVLDKTREMAGRDIDFIINTHVHGDHTGNNAAFAENGSIIITHDNIRRRLLEDSSPAGGPAGLPVITFAEEIKFYVNGNEAYVFHPGFAHTDGDAAILLKDANILLAGDVLFHALFPYIDFDNGGDVDGYIAAQKEMLAMIDDDTTVVPGHGEITDKAGMLADHEMLVEARRRVKAMVDKGMSGEEILAENPLADFDADFNWRFITTERMTETLVRYFSGS
jgi:glyoxylase-like metal-dependent hydrolase (beta-lactamase superfamily II)